MNRRRFEPERFAEFRFTSYEIDPAAATVSLRYALDDEEHFEERLHFHGASFPSDPEGRAALEAAVAALHLISGVSYYKTALPPRIAVETASLSRPAARFLGDLYVQGLSEFAWRNRLEDLASRISFPAADANTEPVPLRLPRRTLVPIGGGKDSIVTLEMLRSGDEPMSVFSVGAAPPIAATARVSGADHIVVTRQLSPRLLELNAEGALNGHVPITAIVSAIACVAAVVYGFDTVAMSNERSASVGSFRWDGLDVNHQYSKGIGFERDMRAFLASEVVEGLEYFSMLRPAAELAIGRAFSRIEGYDTAFTSCNTVFVIDERRRGTGWCSNCPKCRFAFLILAPFMSPDRLVPILGRNLLADESQLDGFLELAGVTSFKPFECVGETRETIAAFRLLAEQPEWRHEPVVRHFRQAVLPVSDQSSDPSEVLELSSDHEIPERYLPLVTKHLGA